MRRLKLLAVPCVLVMGWLASPARAVSIETVPVGNPGNPADHYETPGHEYHYGSVGYTYNIGKYEVTAGQYAAFLNAVAATDTYNLYNPSMANSEWGSGISQAGSSGSYTYEVNPANVNRPVNYVSWGDAARFCNWLHNGQPTGEQGPGTTEQGAYSLNGATTDAELLAVARQPGWQWALPDANEWHKAAYYEASAGIYYMYPTRNNTIPGRDMADASGNNANYLLRETTLSPIDPPHYTTMVGEFQNSESPYGTFDQGGNVAEWNEALLFDAYRSWTGGWYGVTYHDMSSPDFIQQRVPNTEFSLLGFRVVQVPEPAVFSMLLLGCFTVPKRSRARAPRP